MAEILNLRHRRYIRYTVGRGPKLRPFEFDGTVVAEAQDDDYRAAIYRTKGGKYVTEFLVRTNDKSKADVHETLDAAVGWFKPGWLTIELLKILGRWEPEFIE